MISNHQPLRPVSWRRRTDTAVIGIIDTQCIDAAEQAHAGFGAKTTCHTVDNSENNIMMLLNKKKYQYYFRLDLPLKNAYFFKTSRYHFMFFSFSLLP